MRTDIHKPSTINPLDYEFVAHNFFHSTAANLSECVWLQRSRQIIAEHIAKTGGQYSDHEHGGNCMLCGSVNAIYMSTFYHAKTNTYLRFGTDCTERVYGQDFNAGNFRRGIEDARKSYAGKLKAQVILGEANLFRAWEIYTAEWTQDMARLYEEKTIRDIVAKLVMYGSISERQQSFVASLLKRIDDRPALLAKQAEDAASAKDCPNNVRLEIIGEVLTVKSQVSHWGTSVKMLVKSLDGYKVWGTVPAGLQVERGTSVKFVATVTQSPNDVKFGFYSRPSNAREIAVNEVQTFAQPSGRKFR